MIFGDRSLLDTLQGAEHSGRHDLSELLAQVGLGDVEAFGILYDELAPMVYGLVLAVVVSQSVAEDVTRTVFVEMWRDANIFDSEHGSVRTWALCLAHRRAMATGGL